jgi:6,7-dimethyl-8-ribityllumazine synthase
MDMNIIEGKLQASGCNIALVSSRFNDFIVNKMVDGAVDCLTRHGADEKQITLYKVPGTFEIPVTAQRLAETKKYDAIICLSAIIRGSTPHFDFIAAEVTKGIAAVSLQYSLPVVYGVITTDTIEQAIERAGTKAGNKGWDAAISAIEMIQLFRSIK